MSSFLVKIYLSRENRQGIKSSSIKNRSKGSSSELDRTGETPPSPPSVFPHEFERGSECTVSTSLACMRTPLRTGDEEGRGEEHVSTQVVEVKKKKKKKKEGGFAHEERVFTWPPSGGGE